jgi:hypothetical protein
MKIFEAYISELAVQEILSFQHEDWSFCNKMLQEFSGLVDFFETQTEFEDFCEASKNHFSAVNEIDRAEYGDFQTSNELAINVCNILKKGQVEPKMIIEPTFGKGNFILASLKTFPNVSQIIGVEIYKPYVWQTKFSVIEYFLKNPQQQKPSIRLYHQSVFDFDFKKIEAEKDILVLGNPPWVTNAMLSSLGSGNLPQKSNFKNHSGLDAMTGKGNFDIGEYISLMLMKTFHTYSGNMAFLIKNSVIKNIIQEQKRNQFQISAIQKQTIDTQKEFNVSTDAALFWAKMGENQELTCTEIDFYTQEKIKQFGWVNDKFVADIAKYDVKASLDGDCIFEWRQGVKHDCSKVMELEFENNFYINGRNETIDLEQDLVYGLLKSSDLKNGQINSTRKHTIVTQKKVGQDTSYIKNYFPKTWQYLTDNQVYFDSRKSSIYQGKPAFSIFGIGDYSFAPYKVAISGMYKTATFSLVLPIEGKPVMLDDTCYFIGFDNIKSALITQMILNSKLVQDFMQSIIFWDSKRAITKDLLKRINLKNAIIHIDYEYLSSQNDSITYNDWEEYKQQFASSNQLVFFSTN